MKPYKLPKRYLDWAIFQGHCTLLNKFPDQPPMVDTFGYSIINYLSYLYKNWGQGFPVYCVRETLLADMLETDVGEKLELFEQINLAIPSYVLFFPEKTVKSPSSRGEYFINYLVINHQEVDLPEHKYLISWGCVDSGDDLIFSTKRIRKDGTLQRSHFSKNDPEQQRRVLTLRNIVLQSILLLQYYPEIAEDSAEIKIKTSGGGFGISQKQKPSKEYLFPRWLGKERSKPTLRTSIGEGLGAKKSTHFRRGFWGLRACGEGRTERRTTWVRPTWVAADEKSTVE